MLEAKNGEEAVEVATRMLPDLLLIELKLPVLNGFTDQADQEARGIAADTDHRLRSIGPRHHRLALAAGCTAHLEEPIEFDQLDALISQLLPGERLQWASALVH